jgi:hypothetical protein
MVSLRGIVSAYDRRRHALRQTLIDRQWAVDARLESKRCDAGGKDPVPTSAAAPRPTVPLKRYECDE